MITTVFLLVALFAPLLIPYPEHVGHAVEPWNALQPPSAEHWLGTDDVGRDIFSRVVYGTRISLQISLIVVVLSMLIGIPLGLIAGMKGGTWEEVIMRVTDIFLAVPGLVLAIAFNAALGPGIVNAMLALSMVWWPGYTRLIHARTKAIREETYVEAAQAIGVSPARLLLRHVLPNTISTVIVKVSMDLGMVILIAAGLGFVGVGAQPPTPEWGAMTSEGRRYIREWWWVATFPGLAIWITVLGFNLLGDGLRDVLDPKTRPG